MPFDPNSGLVFGEKVVKIGRSHRRDQTRQILKRCLGTPPVYCPPPSGTETLVAITMRTILCNIHRLDSASLSTVPPILLEQIWKAIERSRLDSLRVWQLFAQSSIGDRTIIRDRSLNRLTNIHQTIQIAYHPTCAWVTTLDILTDDISQLDFASLSELKNLRRFHIATASEAPHDKGFNDRVLRSWADLARDNGDFANLKTIFLYLQGGVSQWSLDHISAFPGLDEFCAYMCRRLKRRHLKRVLGWQDSPEDSFAGFLRSSRAYGHAAYGGVAKKLSWIDLVADYVNGKTAASTEHIDNRPVMNVPVQHRPQDGPRGYRAINIEDMVCLKRTESSQPRSDKSPQPSKALTSNSARQPPPKRRRIVFDSQALDDMLAG
ncbi:hypothetical protein Q7P37_008391 [Cladosporium fusiforme]